MICRRNAAHSQPRALEGEIGKAAATTVRGSLFCEGHRGLGHLIEQTGLSRDELVMRPCRELPEASG
jgi:hypothetical protein